MKHTTNTIAPQSSHFPTRACFEACCHPALVEAIDYTLNSAVSWERVTA